MYNNPFYNQFFDPLCVNPEYYYQQQAFCLALAEMAEQFGWDK